LTKFEELNTGTEQQLHTFITCAVSACAGRFQQSGRSTAAAKQPKPAAIIEKKKKQNRITEKLKVLMILYNDSVLSLSVFR
jgi:hypothetical protein